jgi:hypothetical protein
MATGKTDSLLCSSANERWLEKKGMRMETKNGVNTQVSFLGGNNLPLPPTPHFFLS